MIARVMFGLAFIKELRGLLLRGVVDLGGLHGFIEPIHEGGALIGESRCRQRQERGKYQAFFIGSSSARSIRDYTPIMDYSESPAFIP
jgi:hypothetical protein